LKWWHFATEPAEGMAHKGSLALDKVSEEKIENGLGYSLVKIT
jgi:hypothetical protein